MSTKKQQIRDNVFKNVNGFYLGKSVADFYKIEDSTKKTQAYYWLSSKYIDPSKQYAIYKCLQIQPKSEYDKLSDVATLTPVEDLFSIGIQGAVINYNQKTNDYQLTIVDYDDKTKFDLTGRDENLFKGTLCEFGLNSKINGLDLSGGYVGGITLKKMKLAPRRFINKSFDSLYALKYKTAYPPVP